MVYKVRIMKLHTECGDMNRKSLSSGQALVVLLFYMIIAITLVTTAVSVAISNSLSVTRNEEGIAALQIAEAGSENAIVRLLRQTDYAGETLTIGDGTVTASVSGTTIKTITTTGTIGSFSRTIQVVATMSGGILTVQSWQEL